MVIRPLAYNSLVSDKDLNHWFGAYLRFRFMIGIPNLVTRVLTVVLAAAFINTLSLDAPIPIWYQEFL